MIHVGMDISRLSVSQRTGTEQYTWELLDAFGRLDRRAHFTLYANGRPAALPPVPPGFLLRSIPWPRLWTHLRLSLELLRSRPDVLFVPAHVLPLIHPVPSVVTIHDLGYMYYPAAHPFAQRLYLRLSTRWSAARATHLIADSEATKQDLIRFCKTDPAKITVVYLGVGPRFQPVIDTNVLAQMKSRLGLDRPYLLFIGTIQPRKNLVRLMNAFAASDCTGVDLVIAGKLGWLTEEVQGHAEALGIARRVRFVGYVPDQELPALITAARGVLIPSLYEGFGLTALEAMACGTPVLASRVSSLVEVVGDAGILVDPLDTADIARGLTSLVADSDVRETLSQRGRARAAAWTWQSCAEQTMAVLQRVASA